MRFSPLLSPTVVTSLLCRSWAALGQAGSSHVNNHRNEYVIDIFEQLGYRHVKELSHSLRFASDKAIPGFHQFRMLRSTLMGFERYTPLDAPGCT